MRYEGLGAAFYFRMEKMSSSRISPTANVIRGDHGPPAATAASYRATVRPCSFTQESRWIRQAARRQFFYKLRIGV